MNWGLVAEVETWTRGKRQSSIWYTFRHIHLCTDWAPDWWQHNPYQLPSGSEHGCLTASDSRRQNEFHSGHGETGRQQTKLNSALAPSAGWNDALSVFALVFLPESTSTASGALLTSPEQACHLDHPPVIIFQIPGQWLKSFRQLSSISGFQEKSFVDHAIISH